jgi:hypothetical protein
MLKNKQITKLRYYNLIVGVSISLINFKNICSKGGIKQEHTTTSTPQQNGVGKRIKIEL